MADLGNIAQLRPPIIGGNGNAIYHWWDNLATRIISNDRQGRLSGVVKFQNAPVADALVRLYWLPTGVYTLMQTVTDSLGYYEFKGLPRTHTARYQIIVLPRDGSGFDYSFTVLPRNNSGLDLSFNAARHTHLTPV